MTNDLPPLPGNPRPLTLEERNEWMEKLARQGWQYEAVCYEATIRDLEQRLALTEKNRLEDNEALQEEVARREAAEERLAAIQQYGKEERERADAAVIEAGHLRAKLAAYEQATKSAGLTDEELTIIVQQHFGKRLPPLVPITKLHRAIIDTATKKQRTADAAHLVRLQEALRELKAATVWYDTSVNEWYTKPSGRLVTGLVANVDAALSAAPESEVRDAS